MKQTSEFFEQKRTWSVYKDLVLDYYLKPYLDKVAARGLPILAVDLFAGRGQFLSGEQGSPLILANRLQAVSARAEVKLLCFERDRALAATLKETLKPYPFAVAQCADCMQHIGDISSLAKTHTVFLYADPYEVSQLQLGELAKVYARLREQSSVEVLLAFMARAFLRQGAATLAARDREQSAIQAMESIAATDPLISELPRADWQQWVEMLYSPEDRGYERIVRTVDSLSSVAGGNYWETIVRQPGVAIGERLWQLVEGYCARLREWFRIVEPFPIHDDEQDPHPKYWLIRITAPTRAAGSGRRRRT